jgi:CheY-like chemotaxis protein
MKFKGQLILVVEDNQMSYKLIEAYLRNTNLEILHAIDGPSAIELFHNNPCIDLILMDIQLPGMNGLEVTKYIKKQNADIPVIAATANVFVDDKIACMEAGCDSFITKPLDFQELFNLLEKHLV